MLENAIMKNIQVTSNVTEEVQSSIKGNIREELDQRHKALKSDLRNVVNQFRQNVTGEIVTTIDQYSKSFVTSFEIDSSNISRLFQLPNCKKNFN